MTKLSVLGAKLGAFVQEKNQAYGSSFDATAPFFRLLYPKGIPPESLGDALLIARVFDKLMRIATRKGAFGESPWLDVAGYGLLGAHKDGAAPDVEVADVDTAEALLLEALESSANQAVATPAPNPETSKEEALCVAKRIRKALAALGRPDTFGGCTADEAEQTAAEGPALAPEEAAKAFGFVQRGEVVSDLLAKEIEEIASGLTAGPNEPTRTKLEALAERLRGDDGAGGDAK